MTINMELIKRYATQYQDSLITHKEMVTKILYTLIHCYDNTPNSDGYTSEFADELSDQLLKD